MSLPPILLHESQRLANNGANYWTWRLQLDALLGAHGLRRKITANHAISRNAGNAQDELVRAIILLNVQGHEVFSARRQCITPEDVEGLGAWGIWEALEKMHG